MKLKDVLNEMDANEVVAIGGKDGNSFFYISGPKDMDKINLIVENYLAGIRISLDNDERQMRQLYFEKPVEATGDPVKDLSDAEHYANLVSNCLSRIIEKRNYIKKYIPVLEREVVEGYRRTDNYYVLLVSGTEKSKYWFREEFDKGKYGGK